MSRPRPNFFIICAPRCGTTAMSEYLRGHPGIGFSDPKEPHFFAADLPGIRVCDTEEQYVNGCFSHLSGKTWDAIGEGSVWYLYSREAVERILEYNPGSKFVVMVRNPVDMVRAFHEKAIESLDEDQIDFESAWRLQSQRRRGRNIPRRCREPSILQYGKIAKLGEQIDRLHTLVSKDRLHIIVFDDFINETPRVYRDLLQFLGVQNDGRTEFPRINEGRRVRYRWLYELAWCPPPFLMKGVEIVKYIHALSAWGFCRPCENAC